MPYENDDSLVKTILNVEIDHQKRSFSGIGYSKLQAKIIAAKLALKHLNKDFTLWVGKKKIKKEAAYLRLLVFIVVNSKYKRNYIIF